MQVDPIKPTLKAPGITLLKLKYVEPLSKIAFKFNLRRCNKAVFTGSLMVVPEVGRCRLTASNPALKAHTVSALEARI